MAIVQDSRRLAERLRAWAEEIPDQPITVIPYPDSTTATTGYIFRQGRREDDIDAPAQTVWLLERRGVLELRSDGPHGALCAYPR